MIHPPAGGSLRSTLRGGAARQLESLTAAATCERRTSGFLLPPTNSLPLQTAANMPVMALLALSQLVSAQTPDAQAHAACAAMNVTAKLGMCAIAASASGGLPRAMCTAQCTPQPKSLELQRAARG